MRTLADALNGEPLRARGHDRVAASRHDVRVVLSASASLGGLWASDLLEVSSDISRLDSSGRWAVAIPYDRDPVLARFARWSPEPDEGIIGSWRGPSLSAWETSLDGGQYRDAVESIRQSIAAGDVYQANICRVMSAALVDDLESDIGALASLLWTGNPSPYGGFIRLPAHGVHVATASPELYLEVTTRGGSRVATSGPIKGTGRVTADLSDKDAAENIMIVDLVRNDLSIVSVHGSVHVPRLLEVQEHPGLVHLVSYVEGTLEPDVTWTDLLAATFPPGSVTGAPKLAALRLIAELERASRAFYCGAIGWVDADTGEAELAVAIRTFWIADGRLNFGTGAGITWGSDAHAEWRETELKAERLTAVASGAWPLGSDAAWHTVAP